MTEPKPEEQISQEFFIRVNDFIEMANRVERRFDTAHAQLAMLHAFARYSAHHYRTVVKADSEAEREQFADYVGLHVKSFILQYGTEMIGAAPAASDKTSDAAGE